MTVLIAEDDRVYSHLLMRLLKSRGVDSIVAYDAMQAVMMASRTLPAAILLDVNLPGGTGLEVLKRLKHSSKTCMIPIIVMSAMVDPNLSYTVKSLGADAFLSKPIDFNNLYTALRLLMDIEPFADGERPAKNSR